MLLVSSGLWFAQLPGAESYAGVTFLLSRQEYSQWVCGDREVPAPEQLPEGFRVELLGVVKHPVDSRARSFQSAFSLALSDLPAVPMGAELLAAGAEDLEWPRSSNLEPGGSFVTRCPIWSRVRRYQPGRRVDEQGRFVAEPRWFEAVSQWDAGELVPALIGRDEGLVWLQAERANRRFKG